MDGTIIGQGTFNAFYTNANPNPGSASNQAANQQIIVIPSGADWVKVYNYTKAGANGLTSVYFNGTANASVGTEFYWQRGMAAGTGMVYYKGATTAAIDQDTLVSGGFTLYDPSGQTAGALPIVSAPVATTASTNATRPVVSTASTAGLSIGSVVRMSSTAQTDVNGIDMVVGTIVNNTSFTLLTASNVLATAPGAIGGAGFYSIVNSNPLFYPRRRYVVNITQASNAQVSTSVAHGLTPGQAIRFDIPTVSGMIQLNATPFNNYLSATIVQVIDDYNFTINVDTTGFNVFTWPTIAQQPSNFPIVVPFGENTASALVSPYAQTPTIGGQQIYNTNTGILADSTVNTGFLGMILGSGGNGTALTTPIVGPAGSVHFTAGNVIDVVDTLYWVAGKSTYGGQ
jgi:hypothetical protein